jgi:hypothetical protein
LQLTKAIQNVFHQYLKRVHHQGEQLVVQGIPIFEVRALALLSENLGLHQCSANEYDQQVRMQRVVRRFEEMQRTELVSRKKATYNALSAGNVIALSEGIVIIVILLIWNITMEFLGKAIEVHLLRVVLQFASNLGLFSFCTAAAHGRPPYE